MYNLRGCNLCGEMTQQNIPKAGKYLGNEETSALGPIVVNDGLGNDISIGEGERKGFPVKLDSDGCLTWTIEGGEEAQRIHIKWSSTGYVEVMRRGQAINWACSTLQAPPTVASALSPAVEADNKATPYVPSAPPKAVHVPTTAYTARDTQAGKASSPSGLPHDQQSLKEVYSAFHAYIEEAPHRVNVMCFIGGCAVVFYNIWGILNPFDALSNPDSFVKYTAGVYCVFFGLVTCLTELHPEFAGPVHDSLQKFQVKMHEWAKGLTMLWGRGLFYMFQGSMIAANAGISDIIGLSVGVYMMLCGIILGSLYMQSYHAPGAPQENYIRVL